ncbi:MAG: lipoyl(octanoyl) transferase LipB [Eubacteriales bacterium]
MSRNCQVLLLGLRDYQEIYLYQEKLQYLRSQEKIPDTLLLLEHSPVFTIGRAGGRDNVLCPLEHLRREGINIYEVNRGGDVTYHGPGQLVGYPILNLNQHGRDVHRYVHSLETVIIRTLEEVNITGTRVEGYTGVWVGNEKVAAIGIAVKKWVTMHGFALNVNTNLDHFKLVNPCGITDRGVTSISKVLNRTIKVDEVINTIIRQFGKMFDLSTDVTRCCNEIAEGISAD